MGETSKLNGAEFGVIPDAGCKLAEFGAVLEAEGGAVDAVIVGAEPEDFRAADGEDVEGVGNGKVEVGQFALVGEEAGDKSEAEGAPARGEGFDLAVAEVAGMIANAAGSGVGVDGGRDVHHQDIIKGLGGHVGEVGDDTKLGHAAHDLPSEVGQALGGDLSGLLATLRPGEMVVPGQGHVADAAVREMAELAEVILNGMPPFDTEDDGELTAGMDVPGFLHGPGEADLIGVGLDKVEDSVDQLVDALKAAIRQVARVHPASEKEDTHAGLLQAREVHLAIGDAVDEIPVIVDHLDDGVHMAVEEEGEGFARGIPLGFLFRAHGGVITLRHEEGRNRRRERVGRAGGDPL